MGQLPSNILPGLTADWHAPLKRYNYLFTFAFFALAAFAGSASMALFVGAGIWAILSLGLYRFELTLDRGARLIALAFAAYYLSGLINALVHWGDRESLFLLIQRLPFLGFLPVLSRLSLSGGRVTLEAVENGALVGIGLATPVVVFQLFQSNARPEAFSGNPGMFALAMTVLFIVACVAARRRGGRAEIYFSAGVAAAAFCILAAGTRALWPMLVIAPAAAWYFIREPEYRRVLNWRTVAILFAALLAAGSFASERIGKRIDALYQEVTNEQNEVYRDGSLDARLAMWRCAAGIAPRHPIVGMGVDGARQAMRACARDDQNRWGALSHFHNFAIDGLAKGGLIELLARLLALIVPPFVIMTRASRTVVDESLKRPVTILAGLSAATFLASGLFGIFVGHDISDALYLYITICLYAATGSPGDDADGHGTGTVTSG